MHMIGQLLRKAGTMRLNLNNGKSVLIDKQDLQIISEYNWWVGSGGYAVSEKSLGKQPNGKYGRKTILMHRLLLDAPNGLDVDHKNGNKLDNRRSNIRLATRSQNITNTKNRVRNKQLLPRGISFNPSKHGKQPYMARISMMGKSYFLGNFYILEDAVKAYTDKRKELYGEFAPCD